MNIVVYGLLFLSFIFLLSVKSKRSLHMLQSNLYNENNRYLKWVMKNKTEMITMVFVSIIKAKWWSTSWKRRTWNIEFSYGILFIVCIINVFVGYRLFNKYNSVQTKKPLVFTQRVKRLVVTNTILYLIPVIVLFMNHFNLRVVLICSLIICIMTWILWLIII